MHKGGRGGLASFFRRALRAKTPAGQPGCQDEILVIETNDRRDSVVLPHVLFLLLLLAAIRLLGLLMPPMLRPEKR